MTNNDTRRQVVTLFTRDGEQTFTREVIVTSAPNKAGMVQIMVVGKHAIPRSPLYTGLMHWARLSELF